MLSVAQAWALALSLPATTEAERRCKANRLYYAAFHHARKATTVLVPQRRHHDFWLALAVTEEEAGKMLSKNGRALFHLRVRADYKIDEDFTKADMVTAVVLADAIMRALPGQ